MVARDAPQNVRLQVAYAVADGSKHITLEHVEAAYALWKYTRASAARTFGEHLGDALSERIYAAVKASAPRRLKCAP